MRTVLFAALFLAGCPDPDKADTDPAVTGVVCGAELTCDVTEVCIQTAYEPACTPLTDTAARCEDGTTYTMCGGAGQPCCCEPAPEMTYRCYTPTGCEGIPTCDCVQGGCPVDLACASVGSATSGVFQCEALAKP